MEKIYYTQVIDSDTRNSYLSHAILGGVDKNIIDLSKCEDDDSKYLEVEFKINGVEIKFSKFIEEVGKQWNRMVREEAAEVIENKISGFDNRIHETCEEIVNAMIRIAKRKGIEVREEDRY